MAYKVDLHHGTSVVTVWTDGPRAAIGTLEDALAGENGYPRPDSVALEGPLPFPANLSLPTDDNEEHQ